MSILCPNHFCLSVTKELDDYSNECPRCGLQFSVLTIEEKIIGSKSPFSSSRLTEFNKNLMKEELRKMKCPNEECDGVLLDIISDDFEDWKKCMKCARTIRKAETSKETITPDQILKQMAETFQERGKLYKDNYKQMGEILEILLPCGIPTNVHALSRFYLFIQILAKVTRLANTHFKHKDSAHDIGVYAAMLESLIEENK